MNDILTVRDLTDYPRIKKLAAALHRLDSAQHGAAIMIGAGFSRSAARHVGGQKKVPLWTHITKSLIRDLYPNDQDVAFADPLRVAEEYRAYYGQAALNDRIRFEVENDAWRPGPMYRSLLELPWSEILTTNWDTLLEQAALEIHSPYYTVVTKPSDLASALSPRIVHLHGTIGITETLIAAQEDYRTYPERYAAFVNFTRQIFIENELCLLGFSGDDPNFLQWAGWVRDHLADHARKIYLVGALNLSPARRKRLESINIAPVDLFAAVAYITDPELQHEAATELFIKAMEDEAKLSSDPQRWEPTSFIRNPINMEEHTRAFADSHYGAQVLAGQLETLRRDRESYPGWLVCPPSLRWHLAGQINNPFPTSKNLAALGTADREKLLYEIAWRHSITFEYLNSWLADPLFEITILDVASALNKRQQLEIAVVLLNNDRWFEPSDDAERKTVDERRQTLLGLLEKYGSYLPDSSAEVAYQRALIARDRLDYKTLGTLVADVVGADPIWLLRRAALLMEINQAEDALTLIARAYGELRQNHRRDRRSIPILSRLLWAHWLLQAAQRGTFDETPEELPAFAESKYREWKCDPWESVDSFRYKVEERRERHLSNQNPIEPLFEQGHYRHLGSGEPDKTNISEFLLLEGLTRTVGIPLRLAAKGADVTLLAGDAEKIVLFGGTDVELVDLTLAIRCANQEDSLTIKSPFARISVARVSQPVVDLLLDRLLAAIAYLRERIRRGIDRHGSTVSSLRVLIEVVARLSVRVSSTRAKDLFELALSIGQQPEMQHRWLFDVIDHLFTNALGSIPISGQADLLEKALAFPLHSELFKGDSPPYWPNPVIEHPHARGPDPFIGIRIAALTVAIASNKGYGRNAPLLRILPLFAKADFLTQVECTGIAAAIWGDAPDYLALPETGLLPHVLLLLPLLDLARAEELVRRHLYDGAFEALDDTQKELRTIPSPEVLRAVTVFQSMASAAANETICLLPSPAQAAMLFDRLVAWRPPASQEGRSLFGGEPRKGLADSLGRALSLAIVPALAVEDKTATRLQGLQSFYMEIEGTQSVLPGFVHFSSVDSHSAKIVVKVLQRALRSPDSMRIGYGAVAIKKWMELPESRSSNELRRLCSMVVGIIESGRTVGLQQLLRLAQELLEGGWLSDDERTTLLEVLPATFHVTDYRNVRPTSPEAVTASSIREACAKLAQSLRREFANHAALDELIAYALRDPLPEVRFAVDVSQ